MALNTEIVYLGHNNSVDLLLKADGTAVDLTSVNKITASFNSKLISSTDAAAGLITWAQDGYDTGEIRIAVGGESIPAGKYSVPLIVYDPSNAAGVHWGYVPAEVKADDEAAA
jgi:hypothetical protein